MEFQKQLSIVIGKSVKTRRLELGLTIAQLAESAGLSDNHISSIERGKSNISVSTLYKLAFGLGLKNPNELLLYANKEVYPLLKKRD